MIRYYSLTELLECFLFILLDVEEILSLVNKGKKLQFVHYNQSVIKTDFCDKIFVGIVPMA